MITRLRTQGPAAREIAEKIPIWEIRSGHPQCTPRPLLETTSEKQHRPQTREHAGNNGGPTKTVALLRGSPALNAMPEGENGCATATDRIATDQRGVARPQGTACDIGAFEKKVMRRR